MDAPSAEAILISRCRESDTAAFDLIIQQYGDRVYNYARRMVSHPQDAEDIAQEVFIRAFTNIAQFDGRSQLSTWLFRIATNLCIDYHRRKNRRIVALSLTSEEENHEGEEISVPDESANALDQVLSRELQQVVERAVESLSPKLKPVLLLYDMEGMAYEEISKALSLPLGTVKSRLFLARNQVKQAVEQYLGGVE